MNLRIRKLLSALVGVTLTVAVIHGSEPTTVTPASSGTEPGRLGIPTQPTPHTVQAVNQQLANQIVARLNQLPQLKGFRVNIAVQDGVVDLLGFVKSSEDHHVVIQATREVAGVQRVIDRLQVLQQVPLIRTQLLQPPATEPLPQNETGPAPLLPNNAGAFPILQNEQGPPPVPGNEQGPPPVQQNQPTEPTPIYQPQPVGPTAQGYNPPRMPPYAWPTYAPYNNYSRVAYPLSYPYQSWPYIGPIHPYPKIPLGWRSVSLTWQDGFWWYGRNSTGYDWWRLRFW